MQRHSTVHGSSSKSSSLPCPRSRRAFTLADVVVAIGIIGLLGGTLVTGGIFQARETAVRAKCANNLRQIGLGALMYANNEVRSQAFPRTYWNTTSTKLIVDTTGKDSPDSFATKPGQPSPVGDNNVTASFYLIQKTQEISPEVFICPDTDAKSAFPKGSKVKVDDVSNWPAIPGNLSYSYACPFVPAAGPDSPVAQGWKFNASLGGDVPLAADMNPGGDALLKVLASAGKEQMKTVNSRNHKGEGQNVVYCDAHVEFQATPYCGQALDAAEAKGNPVAPLRDNIYTFGKVTKTAAGTGVVGMPTSPEDSILLPTADSGSPATRPLGATK